jgi:plastocyanin
MTKYKHAHYFSKGDTLTQTHEVATHVRSESLRKSILFACMLAVSFSLFAQTASAQKTWYATVGAETRDHAEQAQAFLPNEVWINAGDSIHWTWKPVHEIHTVTFLKPGQTRPTPPPPIGPTVGPPFVFGSASECPSPNPYNGGTATYDGSACVSSAALDGGTSPSTFTVTFPTAGNYKMTCLIHANMNGTIHVLAHNAQLPYMQWEYERQARDQAEDILRDADNPREEQRDFRRSQNEVIMTGEVVATAGGREYLSFSRFFNGTIYVHTGETVEWVNLDPTEPHTVTFGTEPANPQALVGAIPGADGALQATINSTSDSISSGFLQASPEDGAGRPQAAPGTTRIRITFTHPGTYKYICALHDENGMLGTVVVK